MRWQEYYWQWAKHAVTKSWHAVEVIIVASGLILPLISRIFPTWGGWMPDLAWQIPLAVLITLIIVRIILAPYWIAKEQEQKATEETKELQESHQQKENALLIQVGLLATQLKDQSSVRINTLAIRQKKKELLERFIRNGESLLESCKSKTAHRAGDLNDLHIEWEGQVYSDLYNFFGTPTAARFRNLDSNLSVPPIIETRIPGGNRKVYLTLSPQVSQLKKFLHELMEKGEVQPSGTS